MLAFLLLVALVCLAGGGAALFTGFDILLGDRGFPIIVAGSVLLAAGFVLIGLVVVARSVRRLERSILDALERQAEPAQAALAQSAPAQAVPTHVDPAESVSPPSLAPEPAGLKPRPATPALPILVPTLATTATQASEDPVEEMPELPLPMPDSGGMPPHEPTWDEPKTADETSELEPASSATIVGRYSSAGNNYVMFSDGTIEAETPTGHHRFTSLDELRAFVAAGGEGAVA